MLTAEERYQLLEEASALSGEFRWESTSELLSAFQVHEIETEPELGLLLALSQYRLGHQREAFDLVARLADVCAQTGGSLHARQLILAGALWVERGGLDRADHLFRRAVGIAERADDHRVLALATMNSGVVACIKCEWEGAITRFKRALASFTRLGMSLEVGTCSHNLAIACRMAGQHPAAADYLEVARQLFARQNCTPFVLAAETERALQFLARGQIDLAGAAAEIALRKAVAANNLRQEGEALRAVGMVQGQSGKVREARKCLERSAVLARQTATAMLEAEVSEELAQLESIEGDNQLATMHLERAVAIYERMGASQRSSRAADRLRSLETTPPP